MLPTTTCDREVTYCLERWDKCPKGKDLEPGCSICTHCAHFVRTEWCTNGGQGWHETHCAFPKPHPSMQCFLVTRAPEAAPTSAKDLRRFLSQSRPESEWAVNEIELPKDKPYGYIPEK